MKKTEHTKADEESMSVAAPKSSASRFLARAGVGAFVFFFLKGMLWLAVPLIAMAVRH